MNTEYAWLGEQAFGNHTNLPVLVEYQSQQDAVRFLRSVLDDSRGIGLLYGPKFAGKTTIVQNFFSELPDDVAVAFIDGNGIKPKELFSSVLAQFGYKVELLSPEELLKLLKLFVVQQARANQAPILVIDNLDKMYPSALRTLCGIATLSLQGQYAVRVVLIASRRMHNLFMSAGMTKITQRMTGTFELKPLSGKETTIYLHARLTACGLRYPDGVFPVDVCDRLHDLSLGRPGLLNAQAFSAMARATKFPLSITDTYSKDDADQENQKQRSLPKLIVTSNGKTISESLVKEKKTLIGRSALADISIQNDYVSKFHALLVMHPEGLALIDLKSSNGTLVNSKEVKSTVLRENDIISIGNHRIKVLNVSPMQSGEGQPVEADTKTMTTIEETRSDRLRKFFGVAGVNRTRA
jgi:type II secretory pathway predicted ATPase ExeA/pSer/pThr/pTyr-binding forkhead associated (FHA) protein